MKTSKVGLGLVEIARWHVERRAGSATRKAVEGRESLLVSCGGSSLD